MPEEGDSPANNQYTRAAKSLKRWVGDGILRREEKPALYLYEVEYETPAGEKKSMRGFISLLRLEEWDKGIVLPHEGTLKGPKADRFELLKIGFRRREPGILALLGPGKKDIEGVSLRRQ